MSPTSLRSDTVNFVLMSLIISATFSSARAENDPIREPVVATSGNFELRKGTDSFTDAVKCIINQRTDYSIRSFDAAFIVLPNEGPFEGYRVRLDEKPPSDQSYATDYEKRAGAVFLDRYKFDNVTAATRLRIRIDYGPRRNDIDYDIDLAGLTEMVAAWATAGCPKSKR